MKPATKLAVVALSLGTVASCGGSSSGGEPPPDHAPQGNYTQVNVNGVTVDVAKTTINGYTCFVGVNDDWYDDYSPTLWCDPNTGQP